jgi:hypothetical protein
VIRTRDVTLNDNLLYDPSGLDIGAILKEQAEQLIKTLDLLEMQVTEIENNETNLLDILTIEVLADLEPHEAT